MATPGTVDQPRTMSPAHSDKPIAAGTARAESTLRGMLAGKAEAAAYLSTAGGATADAVVTLACHHGLAGLLLSACRRSGVRLPDGPSRRMRVEAARVAGRTNAMMVELSRLLALFADAGIEVMLLKGAAMQGRLYGRADERPMGDLDLLVRYDDAGRACALLERGECRRGMDLVRSDFFPRFYYEVEYLSQRVPAARIDLHARPFRPLRLARTVPDDAFFTDARRIDIDGAAALVPSHETMLIHLAAHAAFHGCRRLLWLHDIHRFLQCHGSDIDVDRLCDRAARWRLSLAVSRGLERSEAAFGPANADVSTAVLDRLRRAPVNWQDRWTLDQAPDDAVQPVRHVLTDWLCTPGLAFPTSYLMAYVRPSDEHLGSLYPLRHPGWRMVAQACRIARLPLRLFGGDAVGASR